jgi:hypothetical protein
MRRLEQIGLFVFSLFFLLDVNELKAIVTPLNETNVAAEADFCNIQFPVTLNLLANTNSGLIFGRIFEAGLTNLAGAPAGITAEVGYGPPGTDPWEPCWFWSPATWSLQVGNDDEFSGSFISPGAGTYAFCVRFSNDGMITATYADVNGAGSNAGLTFANANLGTLTVTGTCCAGFTGNMDCDCENSVNIADLTVLVDHLFLSFAPLCCFEEANIVTPGDNGVDISELTLLVDHLFISFAGLPVCP